jgi:hypothetical protein
MTDKKLAYYEICPFSVHYESVIIKVKTQVRLGTCPFPLNEVQNCFLASIYIVVQVGEVSVDEMARCHRRLTCRSDNDEGNKF